MKSIVRRVQRRSRFATIDLIALEDPRLSALAKTLHTYAVTRSDGWELRITDVPNRFREGERAIYTALRQLHVRIHVSRH